MYIDHSAIKYLVEKKDTKPRLIPWVLLFQEFGFEIHDKKATENLAANLLSQLESQKKQGEIITY